MYPAITLLREYAEETGNMVTVQGREPGAWMARSGNEHRWHVRVDPPEAEQMKRELYEWAEGFVSRWGHVFDDLAER